MTSSDPLSKNRNYFFLAVYACDPGFSKLGQECFQYHPGRDGIGYREAVRICQLEGGQLYEPTDFEQESLVNEFVQSQEEHANYYIGVHDKDTEGNFVYESSGNPVEFVHWDENEPSNHGGEENCVEVVTVKDGKWNDIPCTWKVPFVCQNPARQVNQSRASNEPQEIMFDCFRTEKLTRFVF